MEPQFIKLTEDKYREWDQFCFDSDDAWFWHTSYYINYLMNYKSERKTKNESFFVKDDHNQIIGICPLFLEEDGAGSKIFSFGGDFNPNPCLLNKLDSKEKQKLLDQIFFYIDDLADKNDVKFYNIRLSILADNALDNKFYYNYLINYGFVINNVNTTILDLNTELEIIYDSFRHGHQQNIKKYKDILSVEIFGADCKWEDFQQYKEMHHLAAGRVTRPEKTFRLMHEWIKDGLAFLVGIKKEKEYIGFFLFSVYKNKAYYSSSATNPAIATLPVGHIAIWEAIKYMKEINIKYFEIGWQEFYDGLFKKVTDKEKNLSYFKSGFGGFTKTIFQGIKFYDRNFIGKIIKL